MKTDENGVTPNVSMIKDGVRVRPQMLINRIPVKDVPIDDEKKCSEFLYKMYERKVSQLIAVIKIQISSIILFKH